MITYHHIGGRNGTYPLPLKNSPFFNEFHLILYDADANCFEQMKGKEQDSWGKVDVYPYCIGGKTGKKPFHLNFHPTTNSLYPFNDEFKEYNFVNNPIYGEYAFGDACKLVQSIDLDLFSLEDALTASKITQIDYLSLDVQGAEYDILDGAKTLLEANCVGIQLEVEFVQLYKNQKTFSDINDLMNSMGFELLELGSFGRCAPISLPMGFRGLEQPLYAEAVYIKNANHLAQEGNVAQLYKAALFSLIYKKLGLCLLYLKKISELTQNEISAEPNSLYVTCLKEIWSLYEESQHIKLPKLSQLFSNEKFQNYYGLKEKASDSTNDSIRLAQLKNLLPTVQRVKKEPVSALEKLLEKYGLLEVAEIVKQNRLFEVDCFSQLVEESCGNKAVTC